MSQKPGLSDLSETISSLPRSNARQLIAIAGPPASGKSYLADWLATELRTTGKTVKTVPMDGFHLDNRILAQRDLLARKGAPKTFDAAGFVNLVERIKRGGDAIYPVFDRERDIAIAGAEQVDEKFDCVLFEGNYLLFDQNPWRELPTLWDLSVWLETPETVIRERCVQRWLDHDHSMDEAVARAEGNDVKNGRLISKCRLSADVTLQEGEW